MKTNRTGPLDGRLRTALHGVRALVLLTLGAATWLGGCGRGATAPAPAPRLESVWLAQPGSAQWSGRSLRVGLLLTDARGSAITRDLSGDVSVELVSIPRDAWTRPLPGEPGTLAMAAETPLDGSDVRALGCAGRAAFGQRDFSQGQLPSR